MKTIQIAPADNVAVALCPINAGETVQSGDLSQVVVTEAIPQGHKIALKNIAKEPIPPGSGSISTDTAITACSVMTTIAFASLSPNAL